MLTLKIYVFDLLNTPQPILIKKNQQDNALSFYCLLSLDLQAFYENEPVIPRPSTQEPVFNLLIKLVNGGSLARDRIHPCTCVLPRENAGVNAGVAHLALSRSQLQQGSVFPPLGS